MIFRKGLSIFKFVFLLLLIGAAEISAQQTVGVFQNEPEAEDGYTLIAAHRSNEVYLINNCGEVVYQWTTVTSPGMTTLLMNSGELLRTQRTSMTFGAGGVGGQVLVLDQNSNPVWTIDYSDADVCQHHDVHAMPNGNILIHAWERKSEQECLDAGRNPNLIPPGGIWSDKIVELEKTGPNSFNEVWVWSAWDHLVQDYDETKANYGIVKSHPELLDLNYGASAADWLHTNGLDYNERLDQIVVSSHRYSEFWIIDHSTTTAEAAGHVGGAQGKGGDILYRYGNPSAYGFGSISNRIFENQHDAEWVEDHQFDGGAIKVYNNGTDREYSSVDIVMPPLDDDGKYYIETGRAFGPSELSWTYDGFQNFYSANMSGAQRLDNGNTLICTSVGGTLLEVDYTGQTVWKYVNPVSLVGITPQGSTSTNTIFQARRYRADHPGIQALNLYNDGTLEEEFDNSCQLHPASTTIRIKVRLEGAWQSSTNMMKRKYAEKSLLPSVQPFGLSPYFYYGGEKLNRVPSNMVDWVLVEARSVLNPNVVLQRIPCVLLQDGTVASTTGNSRLQFSNLTPGTSYLFVLRQRNHLDIRTATSVTFDSDLVLDFTVASNVAGGASMLSNLGSGGYGMKAGDFDGNGRINYDDFEDYLLQTSLISVYHLLDANFDTHISVADYDLYKKNQSSVGVTEVLY